jgi:lipopolysaccharide/colanic/teichoic acid biosynthesis glycosyltransferase
VSIDNRLKRGYTIIIAGVILLVASVIILISAIYSLAGLAASMPTDVSAKDLISSVFNMNQTAIKESLRSVGIDVGLASFGLIVIVTLMVNGIIALIGGVSLLFVDRRRTKNSSR